MKKQGKFYLTGMAVLAAGMIVSSVFGGSESIVRGAQGG